MHTPITCDVDGCLVPPRGTLWDFSGLTQLARMIDTDQIFMTLCSGRPATFMEALARQLMVKHHLICENGSVLFHPLTKKAVIHPDVGDEYMRLRPEIMRQLQELTKATDVVIELGKDVMFSINPADKSLLDSLLATIKKELSGAPVAVVNSGRSIEVLPPRVGKAQGLQLWAELEGVAIEDIVAIGDGDNDLTILKAVRRSAAPANCSENVRRVVDYVSPYPMVQGVIDVCRWVRDQERDI